MKTAAMVMAGVLIMAGVLSAQKSPGFSVRNDENFTGGITDSICADGHHIEVTKGERNCILTCVRFDGAQFVLYNPQSKHVYLLDDQKQPEAFAGQQVIVTGRYDKETNAIHVISIRPRITDAGAHR